MTRRQRLSHGDRVASRHQGINVGPANNLGIHVTYIFLLKQLINMYCKIKTIDWISSYHIIVIFIWFLYFFKYVCCIRLGVVRYFILSITMYLAHFGISLRLSFLFLLILPQMNNCKSLKSYYKYNLKKTNNKTDEFQISF